MQDARKAEAAAQKDLDELRNAERMRRMTTLTHKLADIGFPMDSDEDIAVIIEKMETTISGDCDENEVRVLRFLRDVIESSAAITLRTEEEVQQLNTALNRPRDLRARKSTTIAQVLTYAVTGEFPLVVNGEFPLLPSY